MIEVRKLRVILRAGKSGRMKGAFAEAYADLPEDAFAGTVQNMYRTVTVVERYLKIFDCRLRYNCFCIVAFCFYKKFHMEEF